MHRDHLKAELLIGNFSNSIVDFSEPFAFHLLGSPAHIAAVAASLAATVATQKWDGISVDLESLTVRDRPGLTAFVASLRDDLPIARSLSIAITNFTSSAGFSAAGYDLAALGASADRVTLMAYDQHGPWEQNPGPIGALSWQKAGLELVLQSVPASKLELGVAGYGYAWRPTGNVQLSDTQARALVSHDHAKAQFKNSVGEWTAVLSDGSTVWWSDARSYALRVKLADTFGLHGLAVWSLGLTDPIADKSVPS